jgi:integrase
MMDDEQAMIPVEAVEVTIVEVSQKYGDDLALASRAAEQALPQDVFTEYHKTLAPNTKRRQLEDLRSFCTYLEEAKQGTLDRTPENLFTDPEAWKGMHYSLLRGYIRWALNKGFSIGSIGVRLSTFRQYCKLVGPKPEGAGVLDEDTLTAILTVKASNGKKARNIDEQREEQNTPTRIGTKKARVTDVATIQALRLKKTSTASLKSNTTDYRAFIEARDALMMGFLIENAMRCGEVVALNIEDINLVENKVRLVRRKTDTEEEKQYMKNHTRMAAERYLTLLGRSSGPLFLGRHQERMTERAVHHRVRTIGKLIGIDTLSPHDLRHFWAYDAFRNGTPIDKVKKGGGWKSTAMVLRYAERAGVANEGVKITEE